MQRKKRNPKGAKRRFLAFVVVVPLIAVVACFWATGFAHEDGVGDVGDHLEHDPLPAWLIPPGGIDGTDHDFDDIVPEGEQGCFACHDGPVWNHEMTDQPDNGGYVTSATVGVPGSQPGPVSLKCLSCHDGTVPIDAFGGSEGTRGGEMDDEEHGYFGTDLKHHHPVGIVYDSHAAGATMTPSDEPNRYGTLPSTFLLNGKVECVSCHDQHTHAQANNPDNEPGRYSDVHEWGHFVKWDHLCFQCHERYQRDVDQSLPRSLRKVSPYASSHHFPGRNDPWGISRGGANGLFEFACGYCHNVTGNDPDGNSACVKCHATWDPVLGSDPSDGIATSHHGFSVERHSPLDECAVCHADPETGQLVGAQFGAITTPSCGSCHADLWSLPLPDFSVDAGGPYDGEIGESITLAATFVLSDAGNGDSVTASWTLGDGTLPTFPTTVTFDGTSWSGDLEISHVFPVGDTNGIVTLTNGVDDPVTDTFTVTVVDPAGPTADSWNVDPVAEADFEITFEDTDGIADGVFTAVKAGSGVVFGIETDGVIFWFDLEFGVDDWSVGNTYFGNIDRDAGTMNGISISPDGDIDTFTADEN